MAITIPKRPRGRPSKVSTELIQAANFLFSKQEEYGISVAYYPMRTLPWVATAFVKGHYKEVAGLGPAEAIKLMLDRIDQEPISEAQPSPTPLVEVLADLPEEVNGDI